MEKQRKIITMLCAALLFWGGSHTALAETKSIDANNVLNIDRPHIASQDEMRAKALLTKAVSYVQDNGLSAVEDFSKDDQFIDNELYVFALNTKGIFLASGGSSVSLVGSNVSNTVDTQGKPFFQQMIDTAANDKVDMIEYFWNNPVDRSGDPNVLFIRVLKISS